MWPLTTVNERKCSTVSISQHASDMGLQFCGGTIGLLYNMKQIKERLNSNNILAY